MKKRQKLSVREKEERLQMAMFNLLPNENFGMFIDHLRDVKDYNVRMATTEKTLSDARLLKTYLGAVCAYDEIRDIYDNFHQQLEDRSIRAQESS